MIRNNCTRSFVLDMNTTCDFCNEKAKFVIQGSFLGLVIKTKMVCKNHCLEWNNNLLNI